MTLSYDTTEDRTMPAVVYGLYLLAFATGGLTAIVGLILAYANRDRAGERMRSHYVFAIRTFWMSIAWFVIGGTLCVFGGLLSIILIGIPGLLAGILILSVVGIWYALRCILGVIYLAREEPYPRPYAWLA